MHSHETHSSPEKHTNIEKLRELLDAIKTLWTERAAAQKHGETGIVEKTRSELYAAYEALFALCDEVPASLDVVIAAEVSEELNFYCKQARNVLK